MTKPKQKYPDPRRTQVRFTATVRGVVVYAGTMSLAAARIFERRFRLRSPEAEIVIAPLEPAPQP